MTDEQPTPAAPARRRRWRLVGFVVLGAIVSWGVVAAWIVVLPGEGEPQATNVVYVLGPATPERLALAHELLDNGYSDHLMVSVGGPGQVDDCWEERSYEVTCQRSDPFTTRGELMWLHDEMVEHKWTTATVITMRAAAVRTRFIAWQCGLDGVDVLWVGDAGDRNVLSDMVYQSGGFARALANPSC